MTESLRPLNLGGILDRAVQVFRARYMVFFGLGSIVGLADLAMQLSKVSRAATGDGSGGNGPGAENYGVFLISWLAVVGLGAIVRAAKCFAASKINLGEPVTIREAFGRFISKAWRLIGLSFLQGIYAGWPLIITAMAAAFIAGALGSGGEPGSYLVVVFILAGIPCAALYPRYALAFPATAIEGLRAQAAIERSVNLGEGGRWRIFWGVMIPLLPSLMLTAGVTGLMDVLKMTNGLLAANPLLVAGINGVAALIAALVFTPYSSIVLTLLYYDQRMRREGFDVERMMEAAGLDANAASPAAVTIPSPGTEESPA